MKSKKLISIVSFLFVFIAAGCSIQQTQKQVRTITVIGEGEVLSENDRAKITLSVVTKNYDVIKATQENSDKMSRICSELIKASLPEDKISTTQFSIYQEQTYQNGRNVPGQYRVSNEITLSVDDISKVSEFISISLKNGANELSNLSYTTSNKEDALKQARILAIKNAENRATILATSSGNTLGKIMSISEENAAVSLSSKRLYAKNAASDELSIPVMAGSSTSQVRVCVVYELINQ